MEQNYVSQHDSWVFAARAFTPSPHTMLLPLRLPDALLRHGPVGRPGAACSEQAGGGIQGTITDPSGAVVRDAEVTATNTDTGVATTKKTNNDGVYSMILQVGPYNVEVVAKGFSRHLQENVSVDNSTMLGLNIKLSVGGASETITVTDAPPPLATTG